MKNFNVVDMVVGQVIAMWNNNISLVEENAGYFYEPFEGWCADGEVFDEISENEEETETATRIMKEIAPYLDKVSEILAIELGENEE